MAPIKFEEHIKDKLEKRTIKPSNNAWEILSSRLERKEDKPKRKFVWWIGIAASLVGVFLVSTLFFNNENETTNPTLVETPVNEDVKEQVEESVDNVIVENHETSEEKISKKSEIKGFETVKQVVEKQSTTALKKQENPVVVNKEFGNNITETNSIDKESLITTSSLVSDEKNQEIIALNEELEHVNNQVTDSEIESLLEKAQNDIALSREKKSSTKVVNANSLLEDVETDLDKSFRDRMLNTIISSYKTVKTAVAERND